MTNDILKILAEQDRSSREVRMLYTQDLLVEMARRILALEKRLDHDEQTC